MKLLRTVFSLSSILAFAVFIPACGSTSPSSSGSGSLEVVDLTVGTGAVAATGDTLTVNYTGTFLNGNVFDTSIGRGPFTFRLGVGGVIKGWDQGLVGMRVGGKRRLTIPPDLAYGSQGQGTIPGNATLKFDVDLLSIAGK